MEMAKKAEVVVQEEKKGPDYRISPVVADVIKSMNSKSRLIYVVTPEEERFMKEFHTALRESNTQPGFYKYELWFWSAASGLKEITNHIGMFGPYNVDTVEDNSNPLSIMNLARYSQKELEVAKSTRSMVTACEHIEANLIQPPKTNPVRSNGEVEPGRRLFRIYVLADYHRLASNDPLGVRKIKDVLHNSVTNEDVNHVFIFLGHSLQIPDELRAYTEVIDYSLPTREQIYNFVIQAMDMTRSAVEDMSSDPNSAKILGQQKTDYTQEEVNAIVESCLGLSIYEIHTQLAKSLATLGKLDPQFILRAKQQIVHKSDIMEWIEPSVGMGDIGGVDNLKNWFTDRKTSFSDDAKEFGIEPPKGVLMVGIPGTGKSMAAKALGNAWGVPLLHLDVGKIMSGIVGSSESNIRKALKTAEAIAPCILWVDEIEKGFSGTGSSNHSDGGTMARVFGTFLTWMQEKKSPVFVIATANNISQLPPEMMRKGRFDEIFFVDLPGEEERQEILKLHLAKRKQDTSKFDVSMLAKETEGFSGAELEHVIKDAMYTAYSAADKKLTTPMILREIKKTTPLSESLKKEIDAVKEAASRMRFASSKSLNHSLDTRGEDEKPVMKPRGGAESLI